MLPWHSKKLSFFAFFPVKIEISDGLIHNALPLPNLEKGSGMGEWKEDITSFPV
jgi:hypothetical protein